MISSPFVWSCTHFCMPNFMPMPSMICCSFVNMSVSCRSPSAKTFKSSMNIITYMILVLEVVVVYPGSPFRTSVMGLTHIQNNIGERASPWNNPLQYLTVSVSILLVIENTVCHCFDNCTIMFVALDMP